jgi:hypothetical protein
LGVRESLQVMAGIAVCRLLGCSPVVGWIDLDVLVDVAPRRWARMQVLGPTCRRCRGWVE